MAGPYDWTPYAIGGATRPDSFTKMVPEMQQGLWQLLQAADKEFGPGSLQVYSGYRSPELQKRLWEQAAAKYPDESVRRKWVAPPGRSKHNSGQAADLKFQGTRIDKAPPHVAAWIREHAPKYGLAVPMSWEPWQVETANARAATAAPKSPLHEFGIKRGEVADKLAAGAISALDHVSPDQPKLTYSIPKPEREPTAVEEMLGIDLTPLIQYSSEAEEEAEADALKQAIQNMQPQAAPQELGAASQQPPMPAPQTALSPLMMNFGFNSPTSGEEPKPAQMFPTDALSMGAAVPRGQQVFSTEGLATGASAPEPTEPAVSGGTAVDAQAAQVVPRVAGEDPSTLYTPTPNDSPEGAANKERRKLDWRRLAYGASVAIGDLNHGTNSDFAGLMANYDAMRAAQNPAQGLPYTEAMHNVLSQIDPSGNLSSLAQQAAATGNKGLYNSILSEYTDFLGDQRQYGRDDFEYARDRGNTLADRMDERRYGWLTTQEEREYQQSIWERDQQAKIMEEGRSLGYEMAKAEAEQQARAREANTLAQGLQMLEEGERPARVYERLAANPDISPSALSGIAEAARSGLTSNIREATRLYAEPAWMAEKGFTNFGQVLDYLAKTKTPQPTDVGDIIEAVDRGQLAKQNANRMTEYLTELGVQEDSNNRSNVVLRNMLSITDEQLERGALPTGAVTPAIQTAMSWLESLGLGGLKERVAEATGLQLSDLEELNAGQLMLAYQFASEEVRGTGQITENERKQILDQMPRLTQSPAGRTKLAEQMLELNRIEALASDFVFDEYQRGLDSGQQLDPNVLQRRAARDYGRYVPELIRAQRVMLDYRVGERDLTFDAAGARAAFPNVTAEVARRLELGNGYWDTEKTAEENLKRLGWAQ